MYFIHKVWFVGGKKWWSQGYQQTRGRTDPEILAFALGRLDPFQR